MPSIKSLIDQATAEAYRIGFEKGRAHENNVVTHSLRTLAKLNGSGVAVMKSMEPERKAAPPNALAAIAYTMHAIALDAAKSGENAKPQLNALASLARDPEAIDKFMAQTGIVSKSFRRLQTRVHFAEFQLVRKGFGDYDERKHPRSKDGRFISKDAIHEAKTDPVKAEQLRDRVKPEDADKLEDALSGKTDLGRTKAGERKHQTQQKRETKKNSVAEVMRVQRAMEGYGDGAGVDADGNVRHGITAEHLEALAEHLPNLTVQQLREARSRLRERIKWGGKDKKAMVGALTRWAQGEAAGMRGKVEEEQPAEDVGASKGSLFGGSETEHPELDKLERTAIRSGLLKDGETLKAGTPEERMQRLMDMVDGHLKAGGSEDAIPEELRQEHSFNEYRKNMTDEKPKRKKKFDEEQAAKTEKKIATLKQRIEQQKAKLKNTALHKDDREALQLKLNDLKYSLIETQQEAEANRKEAEEANAFDPSDFQFDNEELQESKDPAEMRQAAANLRALPKEHADALHQHLLSSGESAHPYDLADYLERLTGESDKAAPQKPTATTTDDAPITGRIEPAKLDESQFHQEWWDGIQATGGVDSHIARTEGELKEAKSKHARNIGGAKMKTVREQGIAKIEKDLATLHELKGKYGTKSSPSPTLADDAPPVEAKRFPSKHNPEVTYGNEDDRDSDDKYVAGKKRDATRATAQADQIGAELRGVNASHAAKMAEVERLQALGDTESLKQAVKLLGGEVPKVPKAKPAKPTPKPVLDRDPHDSAPPTLADDAPPVEAKGVEGVPITTPDRKWKKNDDGTYTTPNGDVWRKAKAGGETSPVTGRHYPASSFMPIHGKSVASEVEGVGGEGAASVGTGGRKEQKKRGEQKPKKARTRKTRNNKNELVEVPADHVPLESIVAGGPWHSRKLNDDALNYLRIDRETADAIADAANRGMVSVPQSVMNENGRPDKAKLLDALAAKPAKNWKDVLDAPTEHTADEYVAAMANLGQSTLIDGKPSNTEEFARQHHKSQIKAALKAGKTIPPEVLADYPNLQPKK